MANCAICGRKLPPFSLGKRICEWCVRHQAAQRGEEPENAIQPVMPAPWVQGSSSSVGFSQVLVGINFAIFLGMALAGISITNPTSQELVRWGANAGRLTLAGQWWRLITYMFLHIGIIHIAFNMWCLWDLGALCESLFGTWTFGAIYLISGVAGGVASLAWNPDGVSAGASGAIFGLAGALIAAFYFGEFSMPRTFIRTRLRSLVTFAAYNLLFGAVAGRVDNAAHIGGLVAGLVLGLLITRVAPEADSLIARGAVVSAAALMVFGGAVWVEHSRSYILHVQAGSMLFAENKTDQAIAEFQTAIRQRPNYIPAHISLAYVYSKNGKFSLAEAELKKVLELQPQHQHARYALGFIYLSQRRTQEARDTFAEMLAMNQSNAAAHFGLGATFAAEEKYQEAIREYTSAASLDPEFGGAYFNIGLAETRLKNYDNAIAAFLKEREIADDYQTEVALADAYRNKGMQKEADDAMSRAAQLKDDQ